MIHRIIWTGNYKARAYNPRMGRFMQTDPIGYGDGMNMYAYVGNDPMNKVDPWGLAEQCKQVFDGYKQLGKIGGVITAKPRYRSVCNGQPEADRDYGGGGGSREEDSEYEKCLKANEAIRFANNAYWVSSAAFGIGAAATVTGAAATAIAGPGGGAVPFAVAGVSFAVSGIAGVVAQVRAGIAQLGTGSQDAGVKNIVGGVANIALGGSGLGLQAIARAPAKIGQSVFGKDVADTLAGATVFGINLGVLSGVTGPEEMNCEATA
ncbi:hypothetical protein GCM10011342_13360 [Aquisalinus flavus]|uniref:RHS repeat-associated core domain-containing protein n=2 Tax=Aquisalinus flavus TaxID=1526572 RepID=A0A8J2V1W6_9PROT|nr:hypothetical protein GCM10011342_13360 [Aquisalinus flavus]